ncbi:MAG: Ig-like domain-containing protein [Gracilimonas sp.]|uniref:Ig-like domain-containing protein n=1 Tax=Gracilimonas TaxID=649462 RepID=UPI001AFDF45E|nr:Ig-like domain-containing protein [Gracilimonas sp.]MBO6586639.1 Ig-like domain-containing protein [Gracilimonas sp.]MBO6615296.1 Ig-like domain-containing protein [Gracilimonas sp.]
MKTRQKLLFFLFALIIAGIAACATPIAPTGGPADKDGPKVEYTSPETGTTNFTGRTFVFQFDEFIGRSSVQGAITVEPDLGIEYDVSWRRKTMTIEFDKRFPDSTTVIIKLGTDLADTRGNKMERPVTLAISTGNEIDEGKIMGRIRIADDGTGAGDRRVLLYRQPFDLSSKASYEAQTDTGGVFRFSYLADGRYKALLVDDRNRNKTWDRGSESAYPFFDEFITLEKEGSDTLDVIYVTQVDSVAPSLQGVGLFSTNRLRLRFSENINIEEDAELVVQDSAGENYTSAYPLYIPEKELFVVFAQSEQPLLENTEYTLRLSGFTDGAGNPLETEEMPFTGTAQEDTTSQRIISANGTNGLLQDEVFKVTYAAPISEPEITDSLVVIEGQVDFEDWPEVQTNRNELWVAPQGEWIEGVDYQFLVWNPKTLRRKLFEPEVWDSTEYGDIEINLQNVDSTDIHFVQLLSPGGEEWVFTSFRQSTVLTGLPPLSYTLILFRDENGNEKWDRGTAIPFNAPEHYYVQRNLKVQEGFTSEVNITFD